MILRNRFAGAICGALLVAFASDCGAASSGATHSTTSTPPTPTGLSPTTTITQSGPPTATAESVARHDVDVAITETVAALRVYHGQPSNDEAILGYTHLASAHFGYATSTLQRIRGGAPATLVRRAASATTAAQTAMGRYGDCLNHSVTKGVDRSGCPTQRHAADHAAAVALRRVFDLGSYSSQSDVQLKRLANRVR